MEYNMRKILHHSGIKIHIQELNSLHFVKKTYFQEVNIEINVFQDQDFPLVATNYYHKADFLP